MTTIKDVAKIAGVSTATVSHVTNNTRFVRDDTRARVEQAIATLGYRPNTLARAMVTRRSMSIAYLAGDLKNPFFAEVALGAESVARVYGYTVFFCDADCDGDATQDSRILLDEKRIDGIIDFSSAGHRLLDQDSRHNAGMRDIPAVLFEKKSARPNVASILIDTVGGAHQAVEHLFDLGHRHIAFVSGDVRYASNKNRLVGYRDVLARHGLAYDERLAVPGHYMAEGGYEAAQHLLALPDPPTAIFASNDLMAMGVMRAAHERGLGIPKGLSVVGFDDLANSRFLVPALTSISFAKFDMGKRAMEILLCMMEGREAPRETVMPTELITRESTDRVRDPEKISEGGNVKQ